MRRDDTLPESPNAGSSISETSGSRCTLDPADAGYGHERLTRRAIGAPLAFPDVEIAVGDLLPSLSFPNVMRLRPATGEDVETLFDIRCSVTQNHQSREELAAIGVTFDSVRGMIECGDYFSTVAEIEGRPVGFSMAQLSEGYVFACFVRPEFENQGIGRALMAAAEDGLRRAGVATAWLSTGSEKHLRAVGFYLHLGWRPAGLLEDGQMRLIKAL